MMLDDATVSLADTALGDNAQPVLTYLANAMMKVPDDQSPSFEGGIVEKSGMLTLTVKSSLIP